MSENKRVFRVPVDKNGRPRVTPFLNNLFRNREKVLREGEINAANKRRDMSVVEDENGRPYLRIRFNREGQEE